MAVIFSFQEQAKPYNSKTACWVPDKEEGYLAADIKETKGDLVVATTVKGDVSHHHAFCVSYS